MKRMPVQKMLQKKKKIESLRVKRTKKRVKFRNWKIN